MSMTDAEIIAVYDSYESALTILIEAMLAMKAIGGYVPQHTLLAILRSNGVVFADEQFNLARVHNERLESE